MPYQSMCKKALTAAQHTYRAKSALMVLGSAMSPNNANAININDSTFMCFRRARSRLRNIQDSRCIAERKCRKSTLETSIYVDDLRECKDDSHWMHDDEFKRKYRCSREAFDKIVDKIKDHDVFKPGARGPSQELVKHQLMTLLHFLGNEAESNSKQRDVFKVGYGCTEEYRNRAVTALNSLRNE
jgi:hypothetical protein